MKNSENKNSIELPNPKMPENLVRQFHEVYGLPIQIKPSLETDRLNMRMGLITEEMCELIGAVYGKEAEKHIEQQLKVALTKDNKNRDLVETADALADLVYVIYGMALECGINLTEVLAEVQASNMSKLGEDGKPIYREDGKVLKGPNYFKPNIRKALGLE